MIGTRWAALGAAVLLAGCGDSNAPGGGGVTINDLVGTWQITKWEYTSTANTSMKVDLKAMGASATLTVQSSGAYTITGTFAGFPFSSSGTYAVQGNNIVVNEADGDGPQTVPFTLNGNTWTITGLSGDWDFDDDGTDDPATLLIVFTKS